MMRVLFFVIFIKTLPNFVISEGNAYYVKSGQNLEKERNNECDITISEQHGTIRSPGFPDKYPRYSRCEYTIQRFHKDVCEIKLTIHLFDVAKMTFSNCSADFFEIQNDHKRYRLCGELRSGSQKFVFFPRNSNLLVFKFQSTFHQNRGFNIDIAQLRHSCRNEVNITHATMRAPPKCIQVINKRIGRLTFPGTENNQPIDHCTYKIRKSEARACIVQLDFSRFEVAQSDGCKKNYLRMPDGQRLCGVLGGIRKLLQFSPESDELTLEFSSSSNSNNSFDIQVVQLPGPCEPDSSTSRTGTVDDSKHNVV